MKNIVKKLLIVLVCIIILIVIIILLIKGTEKHKELLDYSAEEEIGIDKTIRVNSVDSPTKFYTVQNVLQKYLSYVYLDYAKQEEENQNGETSSLAKRYEISTEQEKKEAILKLLDIDYVDKNNISINNIGKFIEIENDEIVSINVKKMKFVENNQFEKYSIYAKYTLMSGEIKEGYYIVTLDEYNSNFMVEPVKDCKHIDEVKLELNEDLSEIEDEKINNYYYVRVNESEMTQKYFNMYKNMMLNDTREAYEILNEEYRNKRFGSYENFEKFVNNNRDEISKLYVSKYLVKKDTLYKEYVSKDGFQNIWVFRAKAIDDYEVELDTYTIETQEFRETYKNASEEQKVSLNIDKWVKMLNNRDYQAAYNVLDEKFRNDYFGSVDDFEQYMRDTYPLHYTVKQGNINKESNAYVRDIELVDITLIDNYKNESNIIMQLKSGTDFVMSFYVRRK